MKDKNSLYYISSICWQETNNEEIINNNALQKSEYIEIPSNIMGEELYKIIDHKLYESSNVYPWYYNIDLVI